MITIVAFQSHLVPNICMNNVSLLQSNEYVEEAYNANCEEPVQFILWVDECMDNLHCRSVCCRILQEPCQ